MAKRARQTVEKKPSRRKTRAEQLVEQERLLARSPYLQEEVRRLRDELGIVTGFKKLGEQLAQAEDSGNDFPSEYSEGVSFDEYRVEQLDRLAERVISDESFSGAVAELAERYRYPSTSFFEAWLLFGSPAAAEALSPRQLQELVAIETDPPRPNRDLGHLAWLQVAPWARAVKEKRLKSVRLLIKPSTTIADVKAVWPLVSGLQRRLSRARRRAHPQLERLRRPHLHDFDPALS